MNCSTRREVKGSQRSCIDCHTTRTPLWRGGPAGPRSLCNACGLRYRKQNRDLLGLNKGLHLQERKKKKNITSNTRVGLPLNLGLIGVEREKELDKRMLKEEEEAAIMLMALSYDSIFAANNDI
ncbi:hypothetical protein UlMin_030705 [Ulmus minor]